jgi:prevent-host-death family protein
MFTSYTATELRKKFHEAYNQVRFGGTPVTITHHGDDSVILIRKEDVYPEVSIDDLNRLAAQSAAFTEVADDPVDYE